MIVRRVWVGVLFLCTILGVARSASASNYVVYLHGRSENFWPTSALLGVPAGWSNVTLGYNGSNSLGDTSIQNLINNTIVTYCGGSNQCVVVCHSAGCARMLIAYKQLQDQQRYPAGIMWSEAAGSAAGGTEVATTSTKWGARLLQKIFGLDLSAPVDNDIQPNVMRAGTYANIQNAATTPVYHLAGSVDICMKLSIFGLFSVKLCGNPHMPGGYGDGAVPVHSAGGYADTVAHANTNDGGPKYLFRAYEQTPLYPTDHFGILGPLVAAGSLRLAVNTAAGCPNRPTVDASVPDASIVYDDADASVTAESSPLNTLILCGESLWNGQPSVYGSCLSTGGCCTAFSNGNVGGCTCGETLCKQTQYATFSYYTTTDCSGTEYSASSGPLDYESYDGLGMGGSTTKSITARSARVWSNGKCQLLVARSCYGFNNSCCDDSPTTETITARVVYRPAGTTAPSGVSSQGVVVSTTNHPKSACP